MARWWSPSSRKRSEDPHLRQPCRKWIDAAFHLTGLPGNGIGGLTNYKDTVVVLLTTSWCGRCGRNCQQEDILI